jgi:hypothetical protein
LDEEWLVEAQAKVFETMYAFHLRQFGKSNVIAKNSPHSLHGLKLMHKMTSKKLNKMLQHIMKPFCNPMEKMLKDKQKDEITFPSPCGYKKKKKSWLKHSSS